jgi:hypothetical protein
MAYNTFISYGGDDETTSFAIPFLYEKESEVVVSRDGEVETDFVFTSASLITLSTPLAIGEVLTIERVTDIDNPAVLWKNGSGTTGGQLNAMVRQILHAMQEARDTAVRGLFRLATGVYDFQNARGSNLADPIDDQDAVTKAWAAQAGIDTDAAIAARVSAEAAAVNAATSESNAEASETAAAVSAAGAAADRALAQTARTAAETARTAAEAARTTAQGSATTATGAASTATIAAANANNLVLQAQAGWTGYSGVLVDFGSITVSITYFDTDYGTVV